MIRRKSTINPHLSRNKNLKTFIHFSKKKNNNSSPKDKERSRKKKEKFGENSAK